MEPLQKVFTFTQNKFEVLIIQILCCERFDPGLFITNSGNIFEFFKEGAFSIPFISHM